MQDKKHNLPKRLYIGKTKGSHEPEAPIAKGGNGRINTKFADIHWTRTKLSLASTLILAPITFAIVLSFKAGNILVGLILIGALVFMGLMYLALRYIEQNEF